MQTVVNSVLAHYEIFGNNNKETIFILHGWQRNLSDWVIIAKNLAQNYKVVLVDLPGFGSTTLPQKIFDSYCYAEFAKSFLNKLKLKKVILVGHSFGGKIAIILASKNPGFFKKVILVDPSGIEQKSLSVKFRIKIFKILKSLPLPKNIKYKYAYLFGSKDYKEAGLMRSSFVKIINQDVSSDAKKINLPTTLIWGENDREIPIKWAKKLKGLIKKSHIRVVWGSGHQPHLEKPEKFLNILNEIL